MQIIFLFLFSALLASPTLPEKHLNVPLTRQAYDYTCGAASLLAVLFYWNVFDGAESDLYKDLNTTEDGTHPTKIRNVAAAHGLSSYFQEHLKIEDLIKALSLGRTVILDIQAWPSKQLPWESMWENGHYVVLIAVDNENAYFMDPSVPSSYTYIPLNELIQRWHDYETKPVYWKNYQLGIFIWGKKPLESYPAKLIKIE